MDEDNSTLGRLERLWAPWRIEYIRAARDNGCILCAFPAESDDESHLILHRGQHNFIMMNAYPYSPGHLMVAPFKHTAELADLTAAESAEHHELVKLGIAVLRDVARPDGFNVGLNLGRVAGAGIDQHLHTHIVPRWLGDTNFMPVLADTRVMSESLPSMWKKLKAALERRLSTQ
ncbi:MAG: HIT domain-containing protein [Dehalococcoidia bacterium]|nr:HIT domain-containing protein [Dehalococcoidia bacterium]